MNATTTVNTEKHCHKVIFRCHGMLGLVHSIAPAGMILKFDQTGKYACACFDNTIDFNDFRKKLSCVTSV